MSFAPRRSVLLLIAFAAIAVACGGGDEQPSGPTPATAATGTASGPTAATGATATTGATGSTGGSIAGTWEGTWESERFDVSGGFTMTFEPSAEGFEGSIAIQGSDCVSSGNVVAVVDGSTISIGAVQAEQRIAFTGTLDEDEMSGTYRSPAGCGDDAGTWEAHLTS